MTATNAGGDPVIAIGDGVASDLEAAQERLTQLASALGDGDHGVTMTIGARAVRKELGRLEGRGVGRAGSASGGHQDPGATSCYLILESIVRLVKQNASRP